MKQAKRNLARISGLLLGATLMTGCEPVTLTMASIGASVGVSHTLGGIIYKTFTAPQNTVEQASVRALKDMGIEVVESTTDDNGDRVITAKARERNIEIVLEPITPRTTRMRTTANNGLLKDSATATEIVLQTERVLVGA